MTVASTSGAGKLKGLICQRAQETLLAGQTHSIHGADFLVMRGRLEPDQLRCICEIFDVPVYAYRISLASAMALGATGVSTLSGDGIGSISGEC